MPKVKHKKTGCIMYIVKQFEHVAICKLANPYIAKIVNMPMLIDTQICKLDNLEMI